MLCKAGAVSMPFQASAPFLQNKEETMERRIVLYQCPFGLVLHFYRKGLIMLNITVERVSMPSRAGTPFLQNAWVVEMIEDGRSINALSGWYSISTVPLQKPRFYAVSIACFCRYLSEYSDNSRFSCMLTFWTYLMRCTYP